MHWDLAWRLLKGVSIDSDDFRRRGKNDLFS